jgi:hypothetical protein
MLPWLRALTLVLLLNAVFLGFALWVASARREPLRDRVRSAFVTADLVDRDYLDFDSRRGYHQYDECLILQMLINPTESRLSQAVGPALFIQDTTATGYCRTLHRLVVEDADRSDFIEAAYSRYWHGYMPVAAGFLIASDLATARRALKVISYLSLILLAAVAGFRSCGPVRVVGLSFALCGLLLWGLPYFGQLFSHAVGDIAVVLGLVALVAFRERLRNRALFVPFCAAYGACVVYLEFLTGQLPTAAGLLFGTAYAAAVTRAASRREAWRYAGVGVTAFAVGGIVTVAVKQAMATLILGGQALSSFLEGMSYYTASAASGGSASRSMLKTLRRLLQKVDMLTNGNETAAILLAVSSVLTWGIAAYLAVSNDRREQRSFAARSDYLALVAGTAIVAAWIFLFQRHTYSHASFMIRISIVPIALGWAALFWQLRARLRRA